MSNPFSIAILVIATLLFIITPISATCLDTIMPYDTTPVSDFFTCQSSTFPFPLQDDNFDPETGRVLRPDPADYQQVHFASPARLREKMLRSNFACPGALCGAGVSFVQSFPRVRGQAQIPDSVASRDFGNRDVIDYGIGVVALTIGLPILFIILFIFTWGCFCCWRSCCNFCGGRIATKKYSTKRQWVFRLLLLIWAVLVILTLFLAIAANHGFSRGLDTTTNGVDGVFSFIDNATSTLATVTDPFISRMTAISEILTAVSTLPESSDPAQACLSDTAPIPTNVNRMKSQIEFQQAVSDMGDTVKALPTFASVSSIVSTLSPTYTELFTSLEPFTTSNVVDTTAAGTHWKSAATATRSGLNTANFATGLTSATKNFFAVGADIYSTSANVTSIISSSVGAGSRQILYTSSADAIVTTVTQPFTNMNFASLITLFQATNITPQTCNDQLPQIDALLNALLTVVDKEQGLAGGLVDQLAVLQAAIPAEFILQKWKYSLAQLIRLDTFHTNASSLWTLFEAQPLISALQNLSMTDLSDTNATMKALNNIFIALPAAIAAAGGAASDQTNLITTSISTLFNNFQTQLTASSGGSAGWTQKSVEIQTIEFIDACVVDISHQLSAGDTWFSAVSPEIKFMVENESLLTAQSTSPAAGQVVIDNLSSYYSEMGQGLLSTHSGPTTNYISSTANGFTTAYPSQTDRDSITTLATALSALVNAFDGLRLNTIFQYDDAATNQAFQDLKDVVTPNVQTLHDGFETMETISDRYAPIVSRILTMIRNQFITYLTVAKNHLGTCSEPTNLLNIPELSTDEIVGMLTTLKDIKENDLPSDAIINDEISSYSNANDILTNLLIDTTPALSTIISTTIPYSSYFASFDVSTVNYLPEAGSQTVPNPVSTPSDANFVTMMNSLQPSTDTIRSLVVNMLSALSNQINKFVTADYNNDYKPYTNTISSIIDGLYLVSAPIHQTDTYKYSPFIDKPTPWIDGNGGTRDQILLHVGVYAEIRTDSGAAVLETIRSMQGRLDDIDNAISDLGGFVDSWGDTRTQVKRQGYVIDQQRIIIMDVFIACGMVMVFCVAAFACVKFHKMTMVCVMLLCPFVILCFLLSSVHMVTGLGLSDGCRDKNSLVSLAIGNSTLDTSSTAGLVAFISQEQPEPVVVYDLYRYVAYCDETAIPQFMRLLRDTTPESLNVKQDDLSLVRDQIAETLARYGMTVSPRFDQMVAALGGFSTLLAGKANIMYDVMRCANTQPVVDKIFNQGICDGIAQSAALLGALLFLVCFCIFPGLILGCGAFKVMNQRNHELYRRKFIKQETEEGDVVYAHGFIEGEEDGGEIIHYKTEEPGLEDGVRYDQLKGFGGINSPDQRQEKLAQY